MCLQSSLKWLILLHRAELELNRYAWTPTQTDKKFGSTPCPQRMVVGISATAYKRLRGHLTDRLACGVTVKSFAFPLPNTASSPNGSHLLILAPFCWNSFYFENSLAFFTHRNSGCKPPMSHPYRVWFPKFPLFSRAHMACLLNLRLAPPGVKWFLKCPTSAAHTCLYRLLCGTGSFIYAHFCGTLRVINAIALKKEKKVTRFFAGFCAFALKLDCYMQ